MVPENQKTDVLNVKTIIFHFYSGGKIHGEKITALVKIKEQENKKSQAEEYNDIVKEFRDTFNLAEDEYPDDKLLKILKDNKFDFGNAFCSLFDESNIK